MQQQGLHVSCLWMGQDRWLAGEWRATFHTYSDRLGNTFLLSSPPSLARYGPPSSVLSSRRFLPVLCELVSVRTYVTCTRVRTVQCYGRPFRNHVMVDLYAHAFLNSFVPFLCMWLRVRRPWLCPRTCSVTRLALTTPTGSRSSPRARARSTPTCRTTTRTRQPAGRTSTTPAASTDGYVLVCIGVFFVYFPCVSVRECV